jgi:hypothetical protein
MVDDFLLQHVGRRQIIQIVQTVVLQPENIEARLVAHDQFLIRIKPEALRFLALMAVLGMVAIDEILQVFTLEGSRLQSEMLVGAQIVEPDAFGMDLAIFRFGVEEHHVGFDAIRIKDTGGKAQDSVHFAGFQ